MIYVLRTAPSNSARELSDLEGFLRLRADNAYRLRRVRPVDRVVCWGENLQLAGATCLNNTPLRNKYQDALLLIEKGVATVEVALTPPAPPVAAPPPIDEIMARFTTAQELAEEFVQLREPARTQPFQDGLAQLLEAILKLSLVASHPAPVAPVVPVDTAVWLGRLRNHVAGNDLLNPPARPDYYVKKMSLVAEYRVHSFRGVSIRAGKKVKVEGAPSHEWVRSLLGGWKISYDGQSVKQRHRDLAHLAVQALGLDFGAVDLGETATGKVVVLEVNRAPGLDGGTITAYANAIKRWAEGRPAVDVA